MWAFQASGWCLERVGLAPDPDSTRLRLTWCGRGCERGSLGIGLIVDRRSALLRHVRDAPAMLPGIHFDLSLDARVGEGLSQYVLGFGLLGVISPWCGSRFGCSAGSSTMVTPSKLGATYHLIDG